MFPVGPWLRAAGGWWVKPLWRGGSYGGEELILVAAASPSLRPSLSPSPNNSKERLLSICIRMKLSPMF